MPLDLAAPKFADIQAILDAILAANGSDDPAPHFVFWRQTGNLDEDYTLFTTGDVPNVGIPVMNPSTGQELASNFYVILINADGLSDLGIPQMPVGGPFITDADYEVTIDGVAFTGAQLDAALRRWLTAGFPK